MIMSGNYIGEVSTIFLKGEVRFSILNRDGAFDIDMKLPKPMEKVKISFDEIDQYDNSLCGKGRISIMPKAEIESKITFEQDGRIKAFMKIPKLGKVVMKGIHKVD